MKREKRKYLNAGSYSSGTMIAADVIDSIFYNVKSQSFHDELCDYSNDLEDLYNIWEKSLLPEVERIFGSEQLTDILNEQLWYAMQDLCPPYCYFGSHPGNGSDYGIWPDEESIDYARRHEGLIENPDEDPASQEPYVIISDNDNIEYYEWDGEGYVSIWGFA